MKSLDDIEAVARICLAQHPLMPNEQEHLARTLLAMLPVVRAAEKLHGYEGWNQDTESLLAGSVVEAFEMMRRALGGES